VSHEQSAKGDSIEPVVLGETGGAEGHQAASVFISYATEDLAAAQQLRAWLAEENQRTFLADESMQEYLGEADWSERIDRALDEIPVLVVLLSEHALRSRWVEYEWRSVHLDVLQGAARLLIPLWIRPAAKASLPRALKHYQAFGNGRGLDREAAAMVARKVRAFFDERRPLDVKPVRESARRRARRHLAGVTARRTSELAGLAGSGASSMALRSLRRVGLTVSPLMLATSIIALVPGPGGAPPALTSELYPSASRLVIHMDNLARASKLYVQAAKDARSDPASVSIHKQLSDVETAAKPYNRELAQFQRASQSFGQYAPVLSEIEREDRYALLEPPTRDLVDHVRSLVPYSLGDGDSRSATEALRQGGMLDTQLDELKKRKLSLERAIFHQAAFEPPDCLEPGPPAGSGLARFADGIRRRLRGLAAAPSPSHRTALDLTERYESRLEDLESTIRRFKDGAVFTADPAQAANVFKESAKPLRDAIKGLNEAFENASDRRVELLVGLLENDPSDPLICVLQSIESYQWRDLRKLLMLPLTAIISAWQQRNVDAATIADIRRQRPEWDAVLTSIDAGIVLAKGGTAANPGDVSALDVR
jgi:hypothetical protein